MTFSDLIYVKISISYKKGHKTNKFCNGLENHFSPCNFGQNFEWNFIYVSKKNKLMLCMVNENVMLDFVNMSLISFTCPFSLSINVII